MAFYTKSNLLSRLPSRLLTTRILQSSSGIPSTSAAKKVRISGFSMLQIPNRHYHTNHQTQNLVLKKSHYIDRHKVQHFKHRRLSKLLHTPTILVLGLMGLILINTEPVPYTKRTHFILFSKSFERKIGEALFEIHKDDVGLPLPPTHPSSLRVKSISQNIIGALGKGFGAEAAKSVPSHLDGVNWEITVIDTPRVNAFAIPGGKIIVLAGTIEKFPDDAELATVISHEIGHIVARHTAEKLTKHIWLLLLKLVFFWILRIFIFIKIKFDFLDKIADVLWRKPFSRKQDGIGSGLYRNVVDGCGWI